jgi:hypothetical protein
MIQWNDVDYKTQQKVLGLLEDLLLKQSNFEIQDAMVAAIVELEVWSNRPCPVQDVDNIGVYIAQASDPYYED